MNKPVMPHISPHSYFEWKNCNHHYYLKRLSEHKAAIKKKRERQSRAAGIGSAFDAFVKSALDPSIDLEKYLNNEVTCLNRDIVIADASLLFEMYNETALPYLIEDNIDRIDPPIKVDFGGELTIFGKLDATLAGDIPMDWKVRGYWSSPKSPTPGWCRLWKKGALQSKTHKRVDDPFDTIHEKWATQLTMYKFTLGHEPGNHLEVAFDEISIRANRASPKLSYDNVQIVQIRSHISEKFQVDLWNNLKLAWSRINNMDFNKPRVSKYTCKPYGSLCEAAEFCAPQQMLNHPDFEVYKV